MSESGGPPRVRLWGIALITTLTLALAADAQTAPLDLEAVMALAADAALDIRSAETAVDQATLGVQEARAAYAPSVSLFAQPSQRYGLAFDQTTGTLNRSTVEGLATGFNASLDLFDRSRGATVARARSLEQAAEADQDAARRTAQAEAAVLFFDLALSREALAVANADIAAQRDALQQALDLAELGRRPGSEAEGARAALVAAEVAALDAQLAVDLAQTRLRFLLGLSGDIPFSIRLPEVPDLPTDDVDTLVALALEHTPGLRAAERRRQAADHASRAAQAGRLPTVTAFLSASTNYSSAASEFVLGGDGGLVEATPGTPLLLADGTPVLLSGEPYVLGTSFETRTTPLWSQLSGNGGGSIGLSVQIPLWDGGAARRADQSARIERERASDQLAVTEQATTVSVHDASLRLLAARRRTELARGGVVAARAALGGAQDRYDLGAAPLAEVSLALAALTRAQTDQARALVSERLQQTLLLLAIGSWPLTDSTGA